MIFDTIAHIDNYKNLGRVSEALELIAKTDFTKLETGKYVVDGDNLFYMVQKYDTKLEGLAESHYKYIDVQFLVAGKEYMGVAPIECEKTVKDSSVENDYALYECETDNLTMLPGTFAVLYPNDIHRPGMAIGASEPVTKVVVKVKA